MEWLSVALSIVTIISGGGWFVTYRSYKRQEAGKATQSEADGWKAIQDVYQQTIDDMKAINEDARKDRDHFKESRNLLRTENEEMRAKLKDMEEQISRQQMEIERLGHRIDGITPFLCGVVGCSKRKKVELETTN